MFSTLKAKIVGAVVALLAIAAAFFKWRADRNMAKAEKQEMRADALDAKVSRFQEVERERAQVNRQQAERRRREGQALKKGKRTGLDNHWALLAAVLAGLLLGGCSWWDDPLDGDPVTFYCPERPALPALIAEELACLSDEAYRKLLERDRLRREYAEDLEVYCERVE